MVCTYAYASECCVCPTHKANQGARLKTVELLICKE